jgi:acylphosphatase
MRRVRLTIVGRVQGVFYRAHTRKQGVRLGLTGWVRNTEDGGVEAVAEGKAEALDELIKWCRKGPPSARVDDVKVEWEEATGEFENFVIRY